MDILLILLYMSPAQEEFTLGLSLPLGWLYLIFIGYGSTSLVDIFIQEGQAYIKDHTLPAVYWLPVELHE